MIVSTNLAHALKTNKKKETWSAFYFTDHHNNKNILINYCRWFHFHSSYF